MLFYFASHFLETKNTKGPPTVSYPKQSKESDWIEDLIESHNSALELIKKLKKSQETIEAQRRVENSSGQSSRAGFDEDETFKWIKSRSRLCGMNPCREKKQDLKQILRRKLNIKG